MTTFMWQNLFDKTHVSHQFKTSDYLTGESWHFQCFPCFDQILYFKFNSLTDWLFDCEILSLDSGSV